MKNTTIVLGNSAAITEELIEKFGLVIVDFKMDWPEGEQLNGDLFTKMREAKKQNIRTTPKTSQPSIGVYKKAFEEGLAKNENVLCITISSGISGAYNSAMQAKKMFGEEDQKRIFIFDSFNADAAEGLFAIKAAEMIEQGKNIEEIMAHLEELKPLTKLFGMLEGPYWLEAGGRINHTVAVLLSQMQKIGMRPLLSMIDGLVKPANLKMQAKDTANALFKQMETTVKPALEQGKKVSVGISHSDSLADAETLKKTITEKYPQIKIEFVTATGPVIGAHIGPGALICCSVEDLPR
jgi:DegV family protein with EDD domain